MRETFFVLFLVAFVGTAPGNLWGHPGRTDARGCHQCRTNCSPWGLSYGEYHCHGSYSDPRAQERQKEVKQLRKDLKEEQKKTPQAQSRSLEEIKDLLAPALRDQEKKRKSRE